MAGNKERDHAKEVWPSLALECRVHSEGYGDKPGVEKVENNFVVIIVIKNV